MWCFDFFIIFSNTSPNVYRWDLKGGALRLMTSIEIVYAGAVPTASATCASRAPRANRSDLYVRLTGTGCALMGAK